MDELDRRIIQELQENFPLEIDPYAILAARLGIEPEVLWQRVVGLVEAGVIRRMGFSLDSRRLGYASTLAAVRVPAARVDEAAGVIAAFAEVTHSYLRDDAFNIWFTVIAEDAGRIAAILEGIRTKLALSAEDVMDLPVEKMFKLDARFR